MWCVCKKERSTILSQACFPSMKPFGIALGVRISYLPGEENKDRDTVGDSLSCGWNGSCRVALASRHLCLNSWKTMRLGKPCRQMRIPSRTPLHLSWSKTRWGSSFPAWGNQSDECEWLKQNNHSNLHTWCILGHFSVFNVLCVEFFKEAQWPPFLYWAQCQTVNPKNGSRGLQPTWSKTLLPLCIF